MSNPIPPKTHVDTSTQTSPAKKAEPKEKHPITDLATESLNIGSDSLDLNLDLNLDLSDLDIQILTPGDPNVSDINELSLGALNFDLPEIVDITRDDISAFLSSSVGGVLSELDSLIAKGAIGIDFDLESKLPGGLASAALIFIKGSNTVVLREEHLEKFNQNKHEIAKHFNVPVHNLNVVVLKEDEWNIFTSKIIDLKMNNENKGDSEKIKREENTEHDDVKNDVLVKERISRANKGVFESGKSEGKDTFEIKKRLQEEANAQEILRQEREQLRDKKSRDDKQRIDEKELNREILRRERENSEIKNFQLKKMRERKM